MWANHSPTDLSLPGGEEDDDNFNISKYFHNTEESDTSRFLMTTTEFTWQNKKKFKYYT